MSKYNHACDVAFSIDTDQQDIIDVPAPVLLDALQKRVDYLRAHPNEVYEAIGVYDTTVQDDCCHICGGPNH